MNRQNAKNTKQKRREKRKSEKPAPLKPRIQSWSTGLPSVSFVSCVMRCLLRFDAITLMRGLLRLFFGGRPVYNDVNGKALLASGC
jgi:hypothetical protein